MNSELTNICDNFIAAQEKTKGIFGLDYSTVYIICAYIMASRKAEINEDELKANRKLLRSQNGAFSSMRGVMEGPVTCLMTVSGNPQEFLDNTQENYAILKKYFHSSEFAVSAAALITEYGDSGRSAEIAERAKIIYDRMKKKHFFLTSSEDIVYCVLLAMSERSDDELIDEMENIFKQFKGFSDGDTVQAISHILTLAEGEVTEKCSSFNALAQELKDSGKKYGKNRELTVLAALSALGNNIQTTVKDISEADDYLAEQKGYRGILGFSKKERLMHAAMLVAAAYAPQSNTKTAKISDRLAAIAAEELILYRCIQDASACAAAVAATC